MFTYIEPCSSADPVPRNARRRAELRITPNNIVALLAVD